MGRLFLHNHWCEAAVLFRRSGIQYQETIAQDTCGVFDADILL
ncbi:MAG TPA: hypothetical protein PL043_03960 [Methanolinea sp.]|nr:hypothetical protein [Methanolinea sp.]HQJ18622.1 hypothetical protein [Methanolinea sp.]